MPRLAKTAVVLTLAVTLPAFADPPLRESACAGDEERWLLVDRIALVALASRAPEPLLRLDLLADEVSKAGRIAPPYRCSVGRTTQLRSTPRVEDTPADRGFGIDFPGNVVQTLASGSTGWVLGQTVTTGGESWLLCCFAGEVPWQDPELAAHQILVPKRLVSRSILEPQTLIVGWIAGRDLSMSGMGNRQPRATGVSLAATPRWPAPTPL